MERLSISTDTRLTTVDVTDRVADVVPEGTTGTCTVFVPHTTAGIVVQENETGLREDLETMLRDVVADDGWAHDRIDDNADAHLRATLLGPSVTVPVEDGDLALGTWQSLLFVECDGPRSRTIRVTVTDEAE
ncbi:MAG TPA: secondary thiamine-phosphate synthase enzyme YjbQ [Natrialbaceae archaeon]|nr:secondary thiamine-phosphate synthase enzyme YjbQ [Natrialbaceae archaeon]